MFRGEIWSVNLDPTIGSEISKIRPVAIISSDSLGKLPNKIIVPITKWKPHFAKVPWMVRLEPTDINCLRSTLAADAYQVRAISQRRFLRKMGDLTNEELDDITAAVGIVIEIR